MFFFIKRESLPSPNFGLLRQVSSLGTNEDNFDIEKSSINFFQISNGRVRNKKKRVKTLTLGSRGVKLR